MFLNTESVVENFSDIIDSKFNFNNDDLIKISKLFYSSLNDKRIYKCAKKIIDNIITLNFTTEDVMKVMTSNILKNLLEIQSGIIAQGLNKQFEENYELGLCNLKTFIKTIIPKDKRPDFSEIGLSNNKLINLSFEIGNYSKKYQDNNIKIK